MGHCSTGFVVKPTSSSPREHATDENEGSLGRGFNYIVVMTYSKKTIQILGFLKTKSCIETIAENYRLESAHRECDRILLAGFSRGTFTPLLLKQLMGAKQSTGGSAAIKVARLIDVVGIALDSDEKLYKRLYKLCYAAEPWDEEAIREVKRGYQCKWPLSPIIPR
jgi:hypothetical protein